MAKLIVISAENRFSQEPGLIHQLFEVGLSCFHLRRPGAGITEIRKMLNQIDTEFHSRIVLHQFHELASDFGVGGIHFPEIIRENYSDATLEKVRQQFKTEGRTISTSVHTREVLQQVGNQFDYVLFCPVFPSISKTGYSPKENMDVQDVRIKADIVGLGGINPDNIPLLRKMGYQGAALLGSVWKEPGNAIVNFKKIIDLWPKNALL